MRMRSGSELVLVDVIRTVGHEPAVDNKKAIGIDRRKMMLGHSLVDGTFQPGLLGVDRYRLGEVDVAVHNSPQNRR